MIHVPGILKTEGKVLPRARLPTRRAGSGGGTRRSDACHNANFGPRAAAVKGFGCTCGPASTRWAIPRRWCHGQVPEITGAPRAFADENHPRPGRPRGYRRRLAMPTVLRIGPYRFFFYSGDGGEPPHIHVERDDAIAKF